jgi:hypothetical protein
MGLFRISPAEVANCMGPGSKHKHRYRKYQWDLVHLNFSFRFRCCIWNKPQGNDYFFSPISQPALIWINAETRMLNYEFGSAGMWTPLKVD